MTVPFYGSTAGDPTALQRAYAVQAADGVPPAIANFIPFLCYGGVVTVSPKWIERKQILRRPMRAAAMTSKTDMVGGKLAMGDLDPANHMQLIGLLSFFQGYSFTTALGGTKYRISQQQYEDGTPFLKKIAYVGDSDKGLAIRFIDGLCGGVGIGIQPRQNVNLSLDWTFGRFDFWSDPVLSGPAAGTIPPLIRNVLDEQFDASATTGDVIVTIVSVTASTVTYTVAVGAGSPSGSQTATKGIWTYAYSGAASTVPLGRRSQQVQLFFPVGAIGTFVGGDIWTWQSRHSLAYTDVDYPTPMPLAETQFRFYLNGGEIVVNNGVAVSCAAPGATTLYSASGEQPIGTDRKGQHSINVQLDRRLVDMDLQQALMQRNAAAIVLESKNDIVVGTSAEYHGIAMVLPNCSMEGELHDAAEGATNYDEKMILKAYRPASGFTYGGFTDITADIEFIVDTTLSPTDLGIV